MTVRLIVRTVTTEVAEYSFDTDSVAEAESMLDQGGADPSWSKIKAQDIDVMTAEVIR